jgi:hypothetical protein
MTGPRGLSRGRKPYEPPASATEVVGSKSFYTFERFGRGYALNIHRRGQPAQTVLVETEGELNRERRRLSDEGLVGINPRAK